MKKLLGIYIALAIVLSSCLKDKEEFVPYQEEVFANALGIVLNEDGLPVENANVVFGGEVANTDVHGVFIFNDIAVPARKARIKVEFPEYFPSYYVLDPERNNVITLNLIKKDVSSSYDASLDQQVNSNNGGMINVPGSSLKDIAGQNFENIATIDLSYLDPNTHGNNRGIPGGFLGQSLNQGLQLLEHYGSLFFSFSDDMGNELFLKDQSSMTLYFPIPVGSENMNEVALWYYEPSEGIWVEKGTAVKDGNFWKAQVSKEGYWSVQRSWAYTKVTGTIRNQNDERIHGARLVVKRANAESFPYSIWTSPEGLWESYIPQREAISIVVEDECGNVYLSREEGPFVSQTNLGRYEIDTKDRYLKVFGKIAKCNTPADGVEAGYVVISSNNNWLAHLDGQGSYAVDLLICKNEIEVFGRDLKASLSTKVAAVGLDIASNGNLPVGVKNACE